MLPSTASAAPDHPHSSSPKPRASSRPSARIELEIVRAEGREAFKNWGLKLLGLAAVLAVGLAEFTSAARHWEGLILLFGTPPVAIGMGLRRLLDSRGRLRTSALAAGWLLGGFAEATLLSAVMGDGLGRAAQLGSGLVLVLLALWTAGIEGLAAGRGISTRFAACAGIAVAFTLYLAGHLEHRELLNAGLGALFVALIGGGGLGLVLGVVSRWRAGARL